MIKLDRYFPTFKFLNFIKSTVICTRFCSDKKEKNEKVKNISKKFVNEKNKKLFTNLLDHEKQIEAKTTLKTLLHVVKVKAEQESNYQLSDSSKSKISLPLPQKKSKKKTENKSQIFQDEITKSVDNVAKEFSGDVKQIRSDLLNKLKDLKNKESKMTIQSTKVKEILKDFENVEQGINVSKFKTDESYAFYSNSRPLGIFSNNFQPFLENEVKLKIWDDLEKEHLRFLFLMAPENYFEELIFWTEQGKLWHFPIDNEQGLEDEAKVDFTKHIFLEEHLEPWCPKVGPLRHFMELVITGLSKNPYLTVKDKQEHIYWYRDYFENKKKLLLSLGAFDKKGIGEK